MGLGDLTNGPEPGYRAVLWQRLHPRDLGTLGGSVSIANDINDEGQIVGWSLGHYRLKRGFLWEDGDMRDLGTLPGRRTGDRQEIEARAINDAGQVVGVVNTTRGRQSRQRAFLWENGRMTALPALPHETESGATGINDHGQIVGWSSVGSGVHVGVSLHAVVWENGGVRDLGVLTDYGGAAINDRGQIVTSSGYLISNGRAVYLCKLARRRCSINALNDSGQIIGYVFANNVWGSLGALWQGEHVYRLHTGGPADINDHGQMVSTDELGHGVPDEGFLWIFSNRP